MLLGTFSIQVLKAPKDGDDTNSLGNLVPCWTAALMAKKLLLVSRQILLFQLFFLFARHYRKALG